MGLYTTLAQVWYPDETDTAEFNTLLGTMASSIENGIQPRLAKQELSIGLKASVSGWTIPATNTYTTVPVSVTASFADFNKGFSLASGIATCNTGGMYVVTASLAPGNPDSAGGGASCKAGIAKNGSLVSSTEVGFSTVTWINAQSSCVINCVPGDTIQMQGTLAGSPGAVHTSYQQGTYLSIAMVQVS